MPGKHLESLEVIKGEGDFTSQLVAKTNFKEGQMIASFKETASKTKEVRYSSVQVSKNEHVELNSDLVYMNHSCDPSVFVDVEQMKVFALKEIEPGMPITFFYPSTEWEMQQPFQCWCHAKNCLGMIQGAKYLKTDQLKQWKLNPHIVELLKERDQ